MRLIWIIVTSLVDYSSSADGQLPARTRPPVRAKAPSVMWFGVLIYQKTSFSQEYITGITLIKRKLGVGNANDVSHIPKKNVRNTTKAVFLQHEAVVRSTWVTDYLLHPEFNEVTLNTIALVELERDETMFNWELVNWPKWSEQMNGHVGTYYAIGYADANDTLEQELHAMEYVGLNECNAFLQQAQLDKQWLAPIQYQCFRTASTREQCVFESGMALAVYRGGKWKLLGISVLGLGCALPARFIDFARYVPWVLSWLKEKANARTVGQASLPKVKNWMYNKVIIQGADVKINSRRLLRSV